MPNYQLLALNIKYLLALLNSTLYTYVVQQKMITNEQAFPQILMTDLENLRIPIIPIDPANATNIVLAFLVKRLFKLNLNAVHNFIEALPILVLFKKKNK